MTKKEDEELTKAVQKDFLKHSNDPGAWCLYDADNDEFF